MLTKSGATVGKQLVRRLVDDVVNAGDLEIVQLVAEGDTVVARFRCSGTHLGEWRAHAPTGRRFERINEVYFFEVRDDRLARAWDLKTRTRASGSSVWRRPARCRRRLKLHRSVGDGRGSARRE